MAKMTGSIQVDAKALEELSKLSETFGHELSKLWHTIGYEARKAAKMELLSGQKIQFHGSNPFKDPLGRKKISWSLLKRQGGVKVASYPLNFPQYHSILKRDLKAIVNQRLAQWASTFMENHGI